RSIIKPYNEIVSSLVFQDLRYSFAVESDIDRFGELVRAQTNSGCRMAIEIDLHLRNTSLRLHEQVHDPGDGLHGLANFLRLIPQSHQIGSKQFDGDLSTCSRKEMIDPVRDRLTHFRNDTRNLSYILPDFLHHRCMRAVQMTSDNFD